MNKPYLDMIDVSVDDGRITAVDTQKNEVQVRGQALRESSRGPGIPRETDVDVHVRAETLVLPPGLGHVESGSDHGWAAIRPTDTVTIDADDTLLQVDGPITVYLRCTAACTVAPAAEGQVAVSFPRPSGVTVGFRSHVRRPGEVITVRRTTADLAAAISCLAGNIGTESPDRSFPSLRSHPPTIEVGEQFAVPSSLEPDASDTGIAITVPDSLASLFPIAPLAYYLGARVAVSDSTDPAIEFGSDGPRQPLGGAADLEATAADYLRSIFFLDCLVRNAGPYRADLRELELATRIDLDIHDLYDRPIAERASTYLTLPVRTIADRLPDWHLAFYLEPRYRNVRLLSHILDRLATVYRPVSRPYSARDGIVPGFDGAFRGMDSKAARDRLIPDLSRSRLHAWAADGVPIEAFKTSYRAFENHLAREADRSSSISIALVSNDPSMTREATLADATYRGHYPGEPVEYHWHRDLRRHEFRELLLEDLDCLHFIGHCEPAGLQCADGWVSMEALGRTNVRTFFLNACTSFVQGMRLVEQGAIGGVVTLGDVLDGQATKVGTTFANLVVNGYNIANAVRLARSRSILPHSYIAVGDGTYQLPHCRNGIPMFADIASVGAGRFAVTMVVYPQDLPGSFATIFVDGHETTHLTGNEVELTLSRDELRTYLGETNLATMLDGTYYWSTDLAAEL